MGVINVTPDSFSDDGVGSDGLGCRRRRYVLHPSDELPVHLGGTTPSSSRFEFVFLSTWRTVSREMLSANPIATTLSASSCSVQPAWPSGASLHAISSTWAGSQHARRGYTATRSRYRSTRSPLGRVLPMIEAITRETDLPVSIDLAVNGRHYLQVRRSRQGTRTFGAYPLWGHYA